VRGAQEGIYHLELEKGINIYIQVFSTSKIFNKPYQLETFTHTPLKIWNK